MCDDRKKKILRCRGDVSTGVCMEVDYVTYVPASTVRTNERVPFYEGVSRSLSGYTTTNGRVYVSRGRTFVERERPGMMWCGSFGLVWWRTSKGMPVP